MVIYVTDTLFLESLEVLSRLEFLGRQMDPRDALRTYGDGFYEYLPKPLGLTSDKECSMHAHDIPVVSNVLYCHSVSDC
jgi:hypothetical protein